jgi:MYXO-CTERM domain-containing protein
LHLLDETGAFETFAGDSGPDTGLGSIGTPFPAGQVFGEKSYSFDFDAASLSTGDLNLRLAFNGTGDSYYQLTVTARTASSVAEPSSIVPLAAGAAGLGFLAARRRRRKKQ